MSNITGFKRSKLRKAKLTKLDKLIKQQNNASQRIKANLVIEPTSIMIMDSVVNFYKDTQEYLVIAGKDIILDDLKHKLLKDILEGE